MNINNFKLGKKLGSGMFGTTYLATYKKNNYAIKIEKISESNINYNLKIQDWREIDFSESFANKHPEQFIYLYSYDVIDNCTHVQEYPNNKIPQHFPPDVIARLEEKQQSKYCIRKVYSLIDSTFSKIYNTITTEQFYSFLAQISYIALLMKESGYTHNDFHGENLGVLYVNKNKKINILGYLIPTFGLQFKAIDFGNVLHSKYKLNKNEKKLYNFYMKNELTRLIRRMISFESNDTNIPAKLIIPDKFPKLLEEIKKHFLFKTTKDLSNDVTNRFIIFQILYPDEFQKVFLKDKYIKTIYPTIKIDLVDFIFLLNNASNYKKIIKLCYDKIGTDE